VAFHPFDDSAAESLPVLESSLRLTINSIRRDLLSPSCQLLWRESTWSHIHSLAALSHECVVLNHLSEIATANESSDLMGLTARHHLETWIVGIYLLVCDDSKATLRGEDSRAQRAIQADIKRLQQEGLLADLDVEQAFAQPTLDPRRLQYETVFREVDRVLDQLGLIVNTRVLYGLVYRSLSANLGGHPTLRVLDRYVDSNSGFFARIDARPLDTNFRRRPMQFAIVLTCIHALMALGELGVPCQSYADTVSRLGMN
jgi:hypothetical protein